jgi:hypothetical protein
MNLTSSRYRRILVLCAVVALGCSAAFAQTSGAIFTSMPEGVACDLTGSVTGWIVDANTQYPCKELVFLNGGPRNTSSSGLTLGTYFFQVTDPSGKVLLSSDPAVCRQVVVASIDGKGRIAGPAQASIDAGCAHATVGVDSATGGTPVQLFPFNDTPNPGGEYKAWLIPVGNVSSGGGENDGPELEFSQNGVKTDNFKIQTQTQPTFWPLEGRKFYDSNADGIRQESETLLAGWPIRIIGDNPMIDPAVPIKNYPDAEGDYYSALATTAPITSEEGHETIGYSFAELTTGGTYGVCEIIPTGGSTWIATTVRPEHSRGGSSWESQIFCPRHIKGSESDNIAFNDNSCLDQEGATVVVETPAGDVNIVPGRGPADFGNVCLGGGNGRTLGFWSNKNGQALINGTDLAMLVGLNLRSASGANFDPASYASFRTWILNATATNMAYMLSAQLAAMELNVFNGLVDGNALIYAPGTTSANGAGFATVNAVMAEANTELGLHGLTLDGSPFRAYQEALKNALDKANNNLNFVQSDPSACTVGTFGTDCSAQDLQDVTTGVNDGIGPIPAPQP